MNGRIYDPALGRFMTADPHIQSPDNLQSFNRYSYVLNNPLAYVDPTGYFFGKLLANILQAAAYIVGDMVCGPPCGAAFAGAVRGYNQTHSLQGAIQGAINATVSGQLGPIEAFVVRTAINCANGGRDCVRQSIKGEIVGQVQGLLGSFLPRPGPTMCAVEGEHCQIDVGPAVKHLGLEKRPESESPIARLLGSIFGENRTDETSEARLIDDFTEVDIDAVLVASDGPPGGYVPVRLSRMGLNSVGTGRSRWLESHWEKSTSANWRDALIKHYNKHVVEPGKPMNIFEYTRAALAVFRNPKAIREDSKAYTGQPAVWVRVKGQGTGEFTPNGKIIWFHPD